MERWRDGDGVHISRKETETHVKRCENAQLNFTCTYPSRRHTTYILYFLHTPYTHDLNSATTTLFRTECIECL